MPLLMSKLQRDLCEMHQSTMSNLCAPDWKFWLLCNVHKFPLDPESHSELIQLGLCMGWQDFIHIGIWSFMNNLVATKPPKPVQL